MRRIALFAVSFVASAALSVVMLPVEASAVTVPALQKPALGHDNVQLVRRGGHGFRGHGFRGHGFRGHAFRGGHGYRGFRGYGFRGGRYWGHRHGWRRRGWGGVGWGLALGAPYYYGGYYGPYYGRYYGRYYGGYYGRCRLVRRTVWVRRCW